MRKIALYSVYQEFLYNSAEQGIFYMHVGKGVSDVET